MLANIIDHRTRRYRWRQITAIMEPTCHDNSVKDSDQTPPVDAGMAYDERASISFEDAVQWANEKHFPVTLYLYDLGGGISEARQSKVSHGT